MMAGCPFGRPGVAFLVLYKRRLDDNENAVLAQSAPISFENLS